MPLAKHDRCSEEPGDATVDVDGVPRHSAAGEPAALDLVGEKDF